MLVNDVFLLVLKQLTPSPWQDFTTHYQVGDHIRGTVRNVTNFGAFVSIDFGIDGLVHLSDISWTEKIKHPSDRLTVNEEIEAVIQHIDYAEEKVFIKC